MHERNISQSFIRRTRIISIIFLAISSLGYCSRAYASPTWDNAVCGQSASSVTNLSFSYTNSGDTLVVHALSANVTSVTYNGTAMTQVGTAFSTGQGTMNVFYLLNAPTGSHTISITRSNTGNIYANAVSYTGFTSFDTYHTNSAGSGSTFSDTITPTASSTWAIGAFVGGTQPSAGANTTQRCTDTNGLGFFDSNTDNINGSATTLNVSGSNNAWGGFAITMSFASATSSPTSTPTSTVSFNVQTHGDLGLAFLAFGLSTGAICYAYAKKKE